MTPDEFRSHFKSHGTPLRDRLRDPWAAHAHRDFLSEVTCLPCAYTAAGLPVPDGVTEFLSESVTPSASAISENGARKGEGLGVGVDS